MHTCVYVCVAKGKKILGHTHTLHACALFKTTQREISWKSKWVYMHTYLRTYTHTMHMHTIHNQTQENPVGIKMRLHKHIYTYIHAYIHVERATLYCFSTDKKTNNTYTQIHMCTWVHTCTHVYIHTNKRKNIKTYIDSYKYVCAYALTCIDTYIHTCVHTNVKIYIHSYEYVRANALT